MPIELSKALGQSVVINNKGGAAGTIGLLELVRYKYVVTGATNTWITFRMLSPAMCRDSLVFE